MGPREAKIEQQAWADFYNENYRDPPEDWVPEFATRGPDEVMLPPGPAFIPVRVVPMTDNYKRCKWITVAALPIHPVPAGYIWQPATDHTMAGWVRPKGREVP